MTHILRHDDPRSAREQVDDYLRSIGCTCPDGDATFEAWRDGDGMLHVRVHHVASCKAVKP